jgi:hypothetical protein
MRYENTQEFEEWHKSLKAWIYIGPGLIWEFYQLPSLAIPIFSEHFRDNDQYECFRN